MCCSRHCLCLSLLWFFFSFCFVWFRWNCQWNHFCNSTRSKFTSFFVSVCALARFYTHLSNGLNLLLPLLVNARTYKITNMKIDCHYFFGRHFFIITIKLSYSEYKMSACLRQSFRRFIHTNLPTISRSIWLASS